MTNFHVPPGSIVVGVDGSEDAARAVSWAAVQADLENRPLALVHSAEQVLLLGSGWLDAQGVDRVRLDAAVNRAAEAVLAHAREQAQEAAPEVEVTTHLVRDDARIALVDASADAHLVVMGSRGLGPVRSALLGSVSASVAKHANCPVVVCRPAVTGGAPAAGVVVGIDGTAGSVDVLEYAFAQASLHRAPLTVMHCFSDVRETNGPVPADGETPSAVSDLRLLVAESIAGLAEKYPDVAVTEALARGLVDECLADRSPESALLVVGRTLPTGWTRFMHSSAALAVLERAHTTVAVVPEPFRGEEH
jgi:nucleotide-binding universal stress UspA family protein